LSREFVVVVNHILISFNKVVCFWFLIDFGFLFIDLGCMLQITPFCFEYKYIDNPELKLVFLVEKVNANLCSSCVTNWFGVLGWFFYLVFWVCLMLILLFCCLEASSSKKWEIKWWKELEERDVSKVAA